MADLTDIQSAAVRSDAPRILIRAGAGTGKTRTLTQRVVRLVGDGVAPERIVLVTFTTRAAQEMTDRLVGQLGRAALRIRAGTFHRLAHRTLRRFADHLGWTTGFGIVDRDGQTSMMEDAIREAGIGEALGSLTAERLAERIGFAFNTEQHLAAVLPARVRGVADRIEAAAAIYTRLKLERDVMDFDDLLLGWRALLLDAQLGPSLAGAVDHVLVDEYQDTTRIQAAIAEQLAAQASICVVGDDAQAIYAFRGARRDNILRFDHAPVQTTVFRLEQTFRSTPQIVAAACCALVDPRPLKSLRSAGPAPAVLEPGDEADQAALIAERVEALLRRGVRLADQAVLFRAQRQHAAVAEALRRRNLPCVIRSARRLADRPPVRAVLAHLEIIERPLDRRAWRRVLESMPGVGAKTAERLWLELEADISGGADPIACLEHSALERGATTALARRLATVVPLALQCELQAALDAIGLSDLDGKTAELLRDAAGRCGSVDAFLDEIQFTDDPQEGLDAVTLSTVHRAKGLEWPVVFVAGLTDGVFPIYASRSDPQALDEERRVLHVAMTRARDRLYLVAPPPASRLLDDVRRACVAEASPPRGR